MDGRDQQKMAAIKIEPAMRYQDAIAAIESGRIYSHADLAVLFDKPSVSQATMENYLKRLALVPWLTIMRVDGAYKFDIDAEPKAACDRTGGTAE